MMKYLFNLILLISCDNVNRDDLTGYDFRLFQGTPARELADAVKKENIEEIGKIVQEENIDVDYQEPKYGNTLLILAVRNHLYGSSKALVELGADPNKHNHESGTSAMIESAGIEDFKGDNTQFLKLMLSHGGDPNAEEVGKRQEGNTTRNTPLLVATSDAISTASPIEKVKLLVKAGANVNYKNEFNVSPLRVALVNEHYDVVLFLLQEGANYNEILFDRGDYSKNGKKVYITDLLRERLYPLDSEKHRQKMAVVEFLKKQGIDYRSYPIPESVKKDAKILYPNSWQEYLERY